MKKTDLEAVIEGDFTSKPSIDPGIIEGEINRYSSVDFQKLGRTSDDSDESAIPLAGAVFTVYKANEDGTRGDIAIAKDGTKLENLVTNDEGNLCLADDEGNPNEAVILSLERGNYIFVEVNTPEGYVHPEGESNETLVTVGLIGNDVDVVNIKDEKPTPVTETVLPQAYGLTAYDSGLGSHNNNETGDALPEPVWHAQWEGWTVYVNDEEWNIDEKGMPFQWGYFAEGETDSSKVITSAASKGTYELRAWPLEGNPKVTAIDKDGNVWVGTQSEQTTVFWPYPEGASSDDKIAVVRFPTLTRDYTIDQDPEELDAAIAACQPEALAIQKTETGVLFEVPSCGFGPFELMWLTDASGESSNVPGGETGDGPDGQLNDGSEDQLGSSDAATEEKTSSSGDKAGSSLPETSDSLTYVISALLVVVAVSATMGIVAFLRRRDIQGIGKARA